jgi:hypothetical protein
MATETYTYQGRKIPQTKVFNKFINKVPIETIIKLPTYIRPDSTPKPLTVIVNGEPTNKTFTADKKGNHLSGKESILDYLANIKKSWPHKDGKLTVQIVSL